MKLALFVLAAGALLNYSSAGRFQPYKTAKTAATKHVELSFAETILHLGDFNGKAFYIGRTKVSQEQGQTRCEFYNSNLAKIESVDELSFIHNVTTSADNLSWTQGISGFTQADRSGFSEGIEILGTVEPLGLVTQRRGDQTVLSATAPDLKRFYLCYNATVSGG